LEDWVKKWKEYVDEAVDYAKCEVAAVTNE